MKILIIGFAKIKYMPYLNLYLDNIDTNKNEVHILYWNRDLQQEDVSHIKNVTLHEFKCYQEDDVSRVSKIGSFLKFRRFAKKLIKKEKFDFLIVLTSVLAVLLSDILSGKYKNKYFFDYRDVTYERYGFYKKLVQTIEKKSRLTFVSSDAFRVYFPEDDQKRIQTTYNFLTDSLNHRKDKELFGIKSEKIRIAFWGFIRHEEINTKIIKRIGNDQRFELHYYGREQETARNLKKYAETNNIKNVFFHGEYKPEDRYEFIKNTDVIHNIYDDSNMMCATSNKYCDGAIFRIPQICTQGSYMGKKVEEYGIGCAVDVNSKEFADRVYHYYNCIDENQFRENCNLVVKEITFANQNIVTEIKEILEK